MSYHLAEINVARAKADMNSPVMHGFVSRLDEINALADSYPGFVWRLQTDDGDATSLRAFEDTLIIVNMSVWDSVESLKDYTYKSLHVEVFKQRKRWFELFGKPHFAMWWVPAGHEPSVDEAKEKLGHLKEHGLTAEAFTFSKVFPPPTAQAAD